MQSKRPLLLHPLFLALAVVVVSLAAILALLRGGAAVYAQGASAEPALPDPPVEASSLVGPVPTVGVPYGPNGCPYPSYESRLFIHRNEESNNANSTHGWVGSIWQSDSGLANLTYWSICRVPADLFLPVAYEDPDEVGLYDYAVMKLEDSCPAGSYPFSQYFDGEDESRSRRGVDNLWLTFCYFPGLEVDTDSDYYTCDDDYCYNYDNERVAMRNFGYLPFEYGVFAADDFVKALEYGMVHIDDEDTNNENDRKYDAGIPAYQRNQIGRIIHYTNNPGYTEVHLAKVHTPVPGTPGSGVKDFDTCPDYGFCAANPRPIDLSISLHRTATAAEQISYTNIISHFAVAIYEMTEGVHLIRNVDIYQNYDQWNNVDIQWSANGRANADASGYHFGGHIRMTDVFSTTNRLVNVTRGGYTLAHEWGHYYYGLKDEYAEAGRDCPANQPYYPRPCKTDIPVEYSVMNNQNRATGSSPDYLWLNFSIGPNIHTRNVQYRVYEAASWPILKRPVRLDPRVDKYVWKPFSLEKISTVRQRRMGFAELAGVAPDGTAYPTVEITTTATATATAQSLLDIEWHAPGTVTTLAPPAILNSGGGSQNESSQIIPVHIDDGDAELEVRVEHNGDTGNQVTITIRNPGDQIAGQTDCTSTGAKETQCTVKIDNPSPPGEWKVEIQVDAPPIELDYQVVIPHVRPGQVGYVASVANATGDQVQYPEPIVLTALVERELPIARAGVTAYADAPDGARLPLTLLDDGVAPDAIADDGRYTGYLPYDQNGAYWVTVKFDNAAGTAMLTTIGAEDSDDETTLLGEPFQREAHTLILVEGYQSDDHGNTPATATGVSADNADVPGRIDYAGDVDMLVVTPTVSGELVARVAGLGLGMQPVLQVLDTDGTTRLKEVVYTPGNVRYPYAVVTAQAGQPLYVAVAHTDPAAAQGFYFVSIGERLSGMTEVAAELQLDTAALHFVATAGGAAPAAQSLTVNHTGELPLNWTATTDQPWLSVTPQTGATPATIQVKVNANQLAPGTYRGTIQVESAAAVTSPQSVAVELRVQAANTEPEPDPEPGSDIHLYLPMITQ